MKTSDLSIKELADIIGVSTDTIRRAYRKGFIPGRRVGTALRFDGRKVRAQMQKNALTHLHARVAGAPGGESRPRAQQSPRLGNTGALIAKADSRVMSTSSCRFEGLATGSCSDRDTLATCRTTLTQGCHI